MSNYHTDAMNEINMIRENINKEWNKLSIEEFIKAVRSLTAWMKIQQLDILNAPANYCLPTYAIHRAKSMTVTHHS